VTRGEDTSEYGLSRAGLISALALGIIGAMASESASVACCALLAGDGIVVAYIWSRTKLKASHEHEDRPQ